MNNKSFILLFLILIISQIGFTQVSNEALLNNFLKNSVVQTGSAGIRIDDVETDSVWLQYQAHKLFIPASNTKILTLGAALAILSDSLTGAYIQVTNDTLFLKPNADATFFNPAYKNQLLVPVIKNYKHISVLLPKEKINGLGYGWMWNDYLETYMAERSVMPIYGNLVTIRNTNGQFTTFPKFNIQQSTTKEKSFLYRSLGTNNFEAVSSQNFEPVITSPQATFSCSDTLLQRLLQEAFPQQSFSIEYYTSSNYQIRNSTLKSFHTQKRDEILQEMMRESDNFLAEHLLLMCAQKKVQTFNTDLLIGNLQKTLYSNFPDPLQWYDGSGLSRYTLTSPSNFIILLKSLRKTYSLPYLKNIFAIGNTGTLKGYYVNLGDKIVAKTGTLKNNIALSGYLQTKTGKQLCFSIMVNNFYGSASEIRKAMQSFLTELYENN